jgi:aminopeptidase N
MERDPVLLEAYQPPHVLISQVEIFFNIDHDDVFVEAKLYYQSLSTTLFLHGEHLDLLSLKINGKDLDKESYAVTEHGLTLFNQPTSGVLFQKIHLHPQLNTSLSGLYRSGPMLCTQCEAEGFRRIIFYPDRPDVLALFKVTINADKRGYPILLSNGNQVSYHDHGLRHQIEWFDPFPKPAYLFALVAGNLAVTEDFFVTKNAKKVTLKIFTDKTEQQRTLFAMDSLKKSMLWDEDTYGLSYDLNIYHIVATHDFNMGAMENKSLNIFNAKYILGDQYTATDEDYQNILAVVGHEYFHNYTGNRVTLRDWFQLSLKEGLTVFREQQFMQDMNQSPMTRIDEVISLLTHQFPEDSSPLAHPVQPKSYHAIDNFYTATIYNKGAELIRMLSVFIGEKKYYEGVDCYLKKFDGKAATIQDWLETMSQISGQSLTAFAQWYDYAKTPKVDVKLTAHTVELTQFHPEGIVLPIPLSVAFWKNGQCLRSPQIILFNEPSIILERPADSLPTFNHQFIAPIELNIDYTLTERMMLILAEEDGVISWLMMQDYWQELIFNHSDTIAKQDSQFLYDILTHPTKSSGLKAALLSPPSFDLLLLRKAGLDPLRYQYAIKSIMTLWASLFQEDLLLIAKQPTHEDFSPSALESRRLQKVCLSFLAAVNPHLEVFEEVFAHPMLSSKLAVMAALAHSKVGQEQAHHYLNRFYHKYQENQLLMGHWLRLKVLTERIIDGQLMMQHHPIVDLKNPNKVYALVGSFCQGNLEGFHDRAGSGYRWWAHMVCQLDAVNPQVAAKIAQIPKQWQRWSSATLFYDVLKTLLVKIDLSANTTEIIHQLAHIIE